jgi:hypothetical protein
MLINKGVRNIMLAHTIYVFFDGLTREEFHRRLDWSFLVKAWSRTIQWQQLDASTVVLELEGIDGLNRIYVKRRRINDRIYIAARRADGVILQTGVWWIDTDSQVCCCARRIYDADLVATLQERLPDFCFNTFLREAA